MLFDYTKYYNAHDYEQEFKNEKGLKELPFSGALNPEKVGNLESLIETFKSKTKKNKNDEGFLFRALLLKGNYLLDLG